MREKRSKLASTDFETSKFHQEMWNHYVMLGFVCTNIAWNAISNLELRWSYKALQDYIVLPSPTTLSNISWREYALTVEAIKIQLPLWNKVSLALDGWTSTNKFAITLVIAYYMAANLALCQVWIACDKVDHLFSSQFDRWLRMPGQGPTYWIKASRTFEGCAWLFWAEWQLFAWYYNWQCFVTLLNYMPAAINTWGLSNRVAGIEEPPTVNGASHIAHFGCIHEQAHGKRPHQVLGSPWARLAIWMEWNHRRWEESKTSKRGQCWNQYVGGHGTRLSKDNWESTYFMILWKVWSWPSYSRECLLY